MGEKPFRDEYPHTASLLRWVFYVLTCAGVSFAVSGWCYQRGFHAGVAASIRVMNVIVDQLPAPPETVSTEVGEP